MNKQEIIEKVIAKKEFSKLPKKDVEKAFSLFDKQEYSDIEKVKMTRELLKRVFTAFMGRKIMNPKDKDARWFLLRHVSTKERFDFYEEVYKKIFKGFCKSDEQVNVIDLGAGINGMSYDYLKKICKNVNYLGIEGVKQLVDVVNFYFIKNKISGKMINESLFELEKIKKIIKKQKKPRICFLFKTVDSLEMLKKDYTKRFLSELVVLCDRFVVSFATRSFFKKHLFKVRRDWAINYVQENFRVINDFERGGERYLVFENIYKNK